MSEHYLLQCTKRHLLDRNLDPILYDAVIQYLKKFISPDGNVGSAIYFYSIAKDINQACGALLLASSIDLLDDLMDGDCQLENPYQIGPPTQAWMQSEGRSLIECSDIDAWQELQKVYEYQLIESQTKNWTYSKYIEVADGFAGGQFSAFTKLLGQAEHADQARSIGNLSHLLIDLSEKDFRVSSLSELDRDSLFSWQNDLFNAIKRPAWGPLLPAIKWIDSVII